MRQRIAVAQHTNPFCPDYQEGRLGILSLRGEVKGKTRTAVDGSPGAIVTLYVVSMREHTERGEAGAEETQRLRVTRSADRSGAPVRRLIQPSEGHSDRLAGLRCSVPFLAAGLVLAAFHLLGRLFWNGFALDLGSVILPTQGYLRFVLPWVLFGTVAAVLISFGVAQVCSRSGAFGAVRARWDALSDRQFLIAACALGLLIPLLLRSALMSGSPVTDDESVYRFAAELLASGRLWAPSPPLKLFFDQNFMINDGRLYPMYFLGWPALLAPAVWMGVPWIANPVYSALTIPPLFAVTRRFVGTGWARAATLLFLSSPFIQIAAATQLSHTSCLLALTCCLLMFLRTREPATTAWNHAGLAVAFSAAFWIRPQSALALGVPLLLLWTLDLRRLSKGRALAAVGSFAVPSVAFAVLFLATLWSQNGSPWMTGYARYVHYVAENNFLFTTFRPELVTSVPGLVLTSPLVAAVRTAAGLFRLNFDMFGWPSSFALAALAFRGMTRQTGVLWAMVAGFVLVFFFVMDAGIDSFGPVHMFELTLPILILSIIGVQSLQTRLVRPLLAPGLLIGLIVSAEVGFVPVRLHALQQITAHVAKALDAPGRAGIHRAVIFAPTPFAPRCGEMPHHFVNFRPVNDPDLQRDVLWVNDLGPEEDQRFMERFADREGYVMRWVQNCEAQLLPVGKPPPLADTTASGQR